MRAMRMLLVLAVAVLALAVPATARAFIPPNPTVHHAEATSTVGWSGNNVGIAILCGAATVLLGVGMVELMRLHDQRHPPTPTAVDEGLEGQRDLAQAPRHVRVEALRAGERPGEELTRDDREDRREQRHGRHRDRDRVVRADDRVGGGPAREQVAPAAWIRPAASVTDGRVSSREAIAQTGKSESSAATGPCASWVAVSGSAATRQVSISFSAISRAVANSVPRPITNIRPTNENWTARRHDHLLELRDQRLQPVDHLAQPLDVTRALVGRVRREEGERRDLVRVRLRRRDRLLDPRAEREHLLGRLRELGRPGRS